MTDGKYELDFNRSAYKLEIQQLEEIATKLTLLQELKDALTEAAGHVIESVDDLEAYLREKTGFSNLFMAAEAMSLSDEYKELISLTEVDFANIELMENKDGVYVLKEAVRAKIREKHTTYIPEEKRPLLDAVLKAAETLNKLPFAARNCLMQSLNGEYYINIHRFNQK